MCRPQNLRVRVKEPRSTTDHNQCPFTIQAINPTTWLLREEDDYGEFPHIYVKLYTVIRPDGSEASTFIITDTGVGTERPNPGRSPEPEVWTIATFLEHHLNPGNKIPYLVVTTHCHYDHILGLRHLVPQACKSDESTGCCQSTVVASAYSRKFICAERICLHSLCQGVGLDVPDYKVGIWAEDNSRITCTLSDGLEAELDAITLHAPGHTPDSLCWYDIKERTLFVGDHVYEKASSFSRSDTRSAEVPAPILFPVEGNVLDWWQTTEKLISFVEHENSSHPGQPRVRMAAGHVTADSDALDVLKESKEFIARVLAGQVSKTYFDNMRGEDRYLWQEPMTNFFDQACEGFVLAAPLVLCQQAGQTLHFDEPDQQVPATFRPEVTV